MITESSIYWITRMDAIKCVLIMFSIFLPVFLAMMAFIVFFERGENLLKDKMFRYLFFLELFLVAMSTLLPTTKEMIAIKIIPQIVNGVQKHEIPELALKYVNEWLKEELGKDER